MGIRAGAAPSKWTTPERAPAVAASTGGAISAAVGFETAGATGVGADGVGAFLQPAEVITVARRSRVVVRSVTLIL
jgi:hypothetical protein